jgi:hypothetical protein
LASGLVDLAGLAIAVVDRRPFQGGAIGTATPGTPRVAPAIAAALAP